MAAAHGTGAPSPWLLRWAHLIAPGAHVLDVACGSGRHVRWLAEHGYQVTGVDRDGVALGPLQSFGHLVTADIECGPWPFEQQTFDAVLVTNYLWRPLLPTLVASLGQGGVFIYETFASGQQTVGKPSRPDFLLQPGELLQVFAPLRIVAFEDGFLPDPDRFIQRIVAVRELQPVSAQPARHALSPASAR